MDLGPKNQFYSRTIYSFSFGSEKQLTKAITRDEAIQFWYKTAGIKGRNNFSGLHWWYFIGSLKTKVWLEDSFQIIALLDNEAKIKTIIREVSKNKRLAMKKRHKLKLVSHISHRRFFLGLFESAERVVGGVKTRHLIFVVKYKDHYLVFG